MCYYDMYVILTYDVNKKRVAKVMKTCRKFLTHRQKSVFDGIITEGKLEMLKRELVKLVDTDSDSIHIYEFDSLKYSKKEEIGQAGYDDNII